MKLKKNLGITERVAVIRYLVVLVGLLVLISCDPMGDLNPGDVVSRVGYDAVGKNVLADGGFEDGLDSWEFRDRGSDPVETNFQVNADPEYVRSGDQSVKIAGPTWYSTSWSNPADDLPMSVSVWVKGPGGDGSLSVLIGLETILTVSGSHPEWIEYSANIDSVYGGDRETRLSVRSTGDPNLYIDDVEATIKEAGKDLTGSTLFQWNAGDGLAEWEIGGNEQGTGNVTTHSSGNLSFQVDFDANREVRTPEYDLRGRTIDVSFIVTGGTGYSSISIFNQNSQTNYSVNNSFVSSFVIDRETQYFLRVEFDSDGGYTRRLSAREFGDSEVRLYTGTLSVDTITSKAIRIALGNSHDAATTMRVSQVRVY